MVLGSGCSAAVRAQPYKFDIWWLWVRIPLRGRLLVSFLSVLKHVSSEIEIILISLEKLMIICPFWDEPSIMCTGSAKKCFMVLIEIHGERSGDSRHWWFPSNFSHSFLTIFCCDLSCLSLLWQRSLPLLSTLLSTSEQKVMNAKHNRAKNTINANQAVKKKRKKERG